MFLELIFSGCFFLLIKVHPLHVLIPPNWKKQKNHGKISQENSVLSNLRFAWLPGPFRLQTPPICDSLAVLKGLTSTPSQLRSSRNSASDEWKKTQRLVGGYFSGMKNYPVIYIYRALFHKPWCIRIPIKLTIQDSSRKVGDPGFFGPWLKNTRIPKSIPIIRCIWKSLENKRYLIRVPKKGYFLLLEDQQMTFHLLPGFQHRSKGGTLCDHVSKLKGVLIRFGRSGSTKLRVIIKMFLKISRSTKSILRIQTETYGASAWAVASSRNQLETWNERWTGWQVESFLWHFEVSVFHLGVEPKIRGKTPQIIHWKIGFGTLINHPFWGFSHYFWKHPFLHKMNHP